MRVLGRGHDRDRAENGGRGLAARGAREADHRRARRLRDERRLPESLDVDREFRREPPDLPAQAAGVPARVGVQRPPPPLSRVGHEDAIDVGIALEQPREPALHDPADRGSGGARVLRHRQRVNHVAHGREPNDQETHTTAWQAADRLAQQRPVGLDRGRELRGRDDGRAHLHHDDAAGEVGEQRRLEGRGARGERQGERRENRVAGPGDVGDLVVRRGRG